eukprot:CAMPEP_0114386752 /NCGR_PEP_ID=MMETSP0102-20121206/6820_1 /TAXON_ID=38822 ORGANISM="Pteridomonas danica, Strain PT" /NCGR_SAMPLE_ID=MMETSP0102 /ASSEMBLY_ACC=CAM_ASM_000212 /LENGTH=911 /DNA_ID=CAMNT_0001543661 /DNA_START=30 /DNA_END=2765 /DNA_ORIENTATION=-
MGEDDDDDDHHTRTTSALRSALETGTGTPYGHPGVAARRARDRTSHIDGIVRSDYEQEMLLKELSREEALKKRLENGTTTVPNMKLSFLKNNKLGLPTYNDDGGNGLVDVLFDDANKRIERPKKDIDYKALLREHQQRRRGLKLIWHETIRAASSMGATIIVNEDENQQQQSSSSSDVFFALPPDELTFSTVHRHPPHFPSSLLNPPPLQPTRSNSDVSSHDFVAPILYPTPTPAGFFNRNNNSGNNSNNNGNNANNNATTGNGNLKNSMGQTNKSGSNSSSQQTGSGNTTGSKQQGKNHLAQDHPPAVVKRTVQKWNQNEKELFLQYFLEYGKDWPKITSYISTKSESQVKNYYQNYKSRLGLNEKRAHYLANQQTPSASSATTAVASSSSSSSSSQRTSTIPSSSSNNSITNTLSSTTTNHTNVTKITNANQRNGGSAQMSVVSSLDAVHDKKRKASTTLSSGRNNAPKSPRSPHPPPSASPNDQYQRGNSSNNHVTSVSPFVIRNNRDQEQSKKAELLKSPTTGQVSSSSSTGQHKTSLSLLGAPGGAGGLDLANTKNMVSLSDVTNGENDGINVSNLMNGNGSSNNSATGNGYIPEWLSPDVSDWRSNLSMMTMGPMMTNGRVLGLSDVSLTYPLQHMYAPEQLHAAFAAQQVLAQQQQAHVRALSQQKQGSTTPTPTTSTSNVQQSSSSSSSNVLASLDGSFEDNDENDTIKDNTLTLSIPPSSSSSTTAMTTSEKDTPSSSSSSLLSEVSHHQAKERSASTSPPANMLSSLMQAQGILKGMSQVPTMKPISPNLSIRPRIGPLGLQSSESSFINSNHDPNNNNNDDDDVTSSPKSLLLSPVVPTQFASSHSSSVMVDDAPIKTPPPSSSSSSSEDPNPQPLEAEMRPESPEVFVPPLPPGPPPQL